MLQFIGRTGAARMALRPDTTFSLAFRCGTHSLMRPFGVVHASIFASLPSCVIWDRYSVTFQMTDWVHGVEREEILQSKNQGVQGNEDEDAGEKREGSLTLPCSHDLKCSCLWSLLLQTPAQLSTFLAAFSGTAPHHKEFITFFYVLAALSTTLSPV